MRLLLDAHLSGNSVGGPLRSDGHDVRATDADHAFENASDDYLLKVAIAERRILISADTGDFRALLIQIAATGEQHYGVMLIPRSIQNYAFGVLLRSIRHELDGTNHDDWIDRCIWLQRQPG